MKLINTIVAAMFLIILSGCEEVVDVGLETADPRLVVEASINWQKGTAGNVQTIKLSTTTGYFDTVIPKVSGATVFVTNSGSTVFNFIEESEPGSYICNDFLPQINETYQLTVIYEGQTYKSTEKLLASPSVTRVEQNDEGGITGEDMEVKFFFDDIVNQTNFYFLEIRDPYKVIPEYGVIEDRFFQNNEMFGLYISEDLKPTDTLTFRIYGASQDYFNYMDILLEQAGTTSAGPFSTPTSTVRGNIVNQDDFNNYALGFFRLGETDFNEYVIQ
jgi:hypothetical protein